MRGLARLRRQIFLAVGLVGCGSLPPRGDATGTRGLFTYRGYSASCGGSAAGFCGPRESFRPLAEGEQTDENRCFTDLERLPAGVEPAEQQSWTTNHSEGTASPDAEKTAARRKAGHDDECCYLEDIGCTGGRPLLVEGRARVAPARGSGRAVGGLAGVLAAAWRDDALAEHASIASFARAALELMAVGAPPELLVGVQRAALDEIEHARLCFALAARYAGESVEPGPLPAAMPRGGGLVELARHTLREGCVGESVAALAVAHMKAGCRDADVLAALRKIGRDEERHAVLAWRTLAWAIEEGGLPVIRGLQAEWAAVLAEERGVVEGEDDPRLAEHGRLGRIAQRRVRREALEQLIGPTLSSLLVG